MLTLSLKIEFFIALSLVILLIALIFLLMGAPQVAERAGYYAYETIALAFVKYAIQGDRILLASKMKRK